LHPEFSRVANAFMVSLVLVSPLIGGVLLWSIKILVDDVLVAGRPPRETRRPVFGAGPP
jgi:hypothetical protein